MKILVLLICSTFVYIDSIFATDWNISVAKYKHDKACAISCTFDDRLAEHYSLVAPHLESRGFRGTFWINGSKINKDNEHVTDTTWISWAQLKEMSDNGHEIFTCLFIGCYGLCQWAGEHSFDRKW